MSGASAPIRTSGFKIGAHKGWLTRLWLWKTRPRLADSVSTVASQSLRRAALSAGGSMYMLQKWLASSFFR